MNEIYNGNSAGMTATKTPELENRRQTLEKILYELEESIKALEARLEPVLLPDEPIKGVSPSVQAVAEVHSQTVAHLRTLETRALSMTERVSSIIRRLEA